MVFSLLNAVSDGAFWPAFDVRATAVPVWIKVRQRAGNGNRTRMASLEGWNFTIKLCPRLDKPDAGDRCCQALFRHVRFLKKFNRTTSTDRMKPAGLSILLLTLYSRFARGDLTVVQIGES